MVDVLFTFCLTTVLTLISLSSSYLDVDELFSIEYGVEILDKPLLLAEDDVILSSKYGQLYRCSYNSVLEAEKSRRRQENNKDADQTSIIELLKPMESSPCLIHNWHWWTYEFCYKQEIKQYHREKGKIVGDIIWLGHYGNDFDWTKDDVNASMEFHDRFHSQYYENGTVCDLTGTPRMAEVHVFCDRKAVVDYIVKVEEPLTCNYVITVHTIRVCNHRMLSAPEQKSIVPILCHPALSEFEFERYTASRQLKADESNADLKLNKHVVLQEEDAVPLDSKPKSEVDSSSKVSDQLTNEGQNTVKKETHEVVLDGVAVRVHITHQNQHKDAKDIPVVAGADSATDQGQSDEATNDDINVKSNEPHTVEKDAEFPPQRAEVKIINAAYYDLNGIPVGKYKNRNGKETTLSETVMAILGTNVDEIQEYKNHRQMLDNYSFKWNDVTEQNEQEQKSDE